MKSSCIHVPLPWTYKEPLPKVQLCSWTTNYCLGKAEVHLSNPRCLRVWHLELVFLQSSCLPAVELVMRTTNTGQTVYFFHYCSLRALITFRSIPIAIFEWPAGSQSLHWSVQTEEFFGCSCEKVFFSPLAWNVLKALCEHRFLKLDIYSWTFSNKYPTASVFS